jgi:hypothetical protein
MSDTAKRETVLEAWLRMCCETPEFVKNYNRLYGTSLRFELPARAPIERLVDQACGYTPTLGNDVGELQQFFEHCRDLLLMWPGLDDQRNFVQPTEAQ